MLKKTGIGIFIILLALVAILTSRAMLLKPTAQHIQELQPVTFDQQQAVEHLSQAIQFKTISQVLPAKDNQPPRSLVDSGTFQRFHDFIDIAFPLIQSRLDRQLIKEHSLLYQWPGTDPDLSPIVLMAHQDVVPFALPNLDVWEHPPFSGEVADGFIWGRGTLDDKSSMIAIMEAAESLLAAGWQPQRTLYLAFGHDEEVGGRGALAIADWIKAQGIAPQMVLDEGGFVVLNLIPGVPQPIGLVGIAEKGFVSVVLQAAGQPGHSSMPPPQTAAGIVAAAVAKLEQHPPAMRFDGATRQLFETVSPYMAFGKRLVFANLWLFEPVVLKILEGSPSSNAMVRTTQAVTMFNSGQKDNVLPSSASAVVNYRLLPNDTSENLLDNIQSIIADERVSLSTYPFNSEASSLSDSDNASFEALKRVGESLFEQDKVVMSPYLTIGATDARHFQGIARNQYRFLPIPMTKEDLGRLHGPNERIAVEDYLKMISFYANLIRELNQS